MIYARIQSDLVEGQEKDSKSPASNCQESIPSRCSLNPNSLVNKSCAKKRICLGEGHADAFSNVVRNSYLFSPNKIPPYMHVSEFTIVSCNPQQLFAFFTADHNRTRLRR